MSVVFGALASLVVSGSRATSNRDYIDDLYASQARILKTIREDVDDGVSLATPGGNLQVTTDEGTHTYIVSGGVLRRGSSEISLPGVVVSEFTAALYSTEPAPDGVSVSFVLSHEEKAEEIIFIEHSFVIYE